MTKQKRRRGDSLAKKAWDHIAGGEGYDAREVLSKLLDKYPERADREVTLLFAWSFEVEGRICKAEDWTRNLLEKHPDYIEAWELLAHLLSEMEDRLDELEEVVGHSIKIGADSVSMLRKLGHGYSHNERKDDAVRIFEGIVQRNPEDPLSWDHLGYEQYFAGKHEDSLFSWKKKLELKPDDERAQHWIKHVQYELDARKQDVGTVGEET